MANLKNSVFSLCYLQEFCYTNEIDIKDIVKHEPEVGKPKVEI